MLPKVGCQLRAAIHGLVTRPRAKSKWRVPDYAATAERYRILGRRWTSVLDGGTSAIQADAAGRTRRSNIRITSQPNHIPTQNCRQPATLVVLIGWR